MSAKPITLIQITDSHIFDDPNGKLSGVNTRESLQLVLQAVKKDFSHADLLILTGDNTHEATEIAYLHLRGMVEKLDIPYAFLAGNHDYEKPMMALSSDTNAGEETDINKWMSIGGWNILLLDSHVERRVNGFFSDDELNFANVMLSANSNPTIAFVHHPLLPVGCNWLDRQRIANADDFFNIATKNSCLKAIINGHVHQEWSGEHRGIKLFSTPSTCMQFKTNSAEYAEENINPGFRWIKLFENGSIETAVVRI